MNIDKIIDFLETETLSVTLTPTGLKYLSLKGNKGEEIINLKTITNKNDTNSKEYLLIKETYDFLKTGSHNMKLDLTECTEFQRSVFEAVKKIKPGDLLSYKDIAEMIGKSGAAQAVGSAVSKNPVAYFLPTHRVVSKKGLATCKSGAGFLRDKLLKHEGHDVEKLKGDYVCKRKKCCVDTSN